jgi:hypothetical protein
VADENVFEYKKERLQFSGDPAIQFSGDPAIQFSRKLQFSGDPAIQFSRNECVEEEE